MEFVEAIKSIPLTFYSRSFYGRLAREGSGIGMKYVLLVVLLELIGSAIWQPIFREMPSAAIGAGIVLVFWVTVLVVIGATVIQLMALALKTSIPLDMKRALRLSAAASVPLAVLDVVLAIAMPSVLPVPVLIKIGLWFCFAAFALYAICKPPATTAEL